MYDVFFSYPHKDSEKVMLILEALQARGLKVWIDRNEIRDLQASPGGIIQVIKDNIKFKDSESCHQKIPITIG